MARCAPAEDENKIQSTTQLSLRQTLSVPARTVVLEKCPVYRRFRYSEMTDKKHAETDISCPSYRGVHRKEVSVKRRLTVQQEFFF